MTRLCYKIYTCKFLIVPLLIFGLGKFFIEERQILLYEDNHKDAISVQTEPLLTLFTSWNSTHKKYLCHNNTVTNWKSLSPLILPVLFTNEIMLADIVKKRGWHVLPVRKSALGLPVLKFMFMDAQAAFQTKFLCYANADILFTESLLRTLSIILDHGKINTEINPNLLLTGRRINVVNVSKIEASSPTNVARVAERGDLYSGDALDYFITSRNYSWKYSPEVVTGRTGIDNWIVANARMLNHKLIDTTETIIAVHQTTDAGDTESHYKKNESYNTDLIYKFNDRLRINLGVTSCIRLKTVLINKTVEIREKSYITPSCFPVVLTDEMIKNIEKIKKYRKQYKMKQTKSTK